MFNSSILDVAMGMIFVYLLLSLICSAANEILELWLKNRAADLERGIRELLVPGTAPGNSELVRRLYDHGLVNGLFGGNYENSGIANVGRFIRRTQLPSYIPSRNFALALMDLILPGTPARPSPGPNAAQPVVAAQPSGAAGATPATFDVKLNAPPPPPATAITEGNPLQPLRNAPNNHPLIPADARQSLITLIDAAGNDAAKARENIENWFNSSMDRVSGSYKRRSQKILLVLGLFVAIGVNADSVLIAKRLSADRALRDSLVAAAEEYAKVNAAPSASPSASPATSPAETTPTPAATPCVTPQCKYNESLQEIKSLALPIGWDSGIDPQTRWPGLHFWEGKFWTDWRIQARSHFYGWLLTALAISLGAPFWFDMLNKFIVVRSTVKPHEKSREEGSKD